MKTSVGKILHPEAVECTAATVAVLLASILVKLWMARFNRTLGKKIDSTALMATAADSRNDVIEYSINGVKQTPATYSRTNR